MRVIQSTRSNNSECALNRIVADIFHAFRWELFCLKLRVDHNRPGSSGNPRSSKPHEKDVNHNIVQWVKKDPAKKWVKLLEHRQPADSLHPFGKDLDFNQETVKPSAVSCFHRRTRYFSVAMQAPLFNDSDREGVRACRAEQTREIPCWADVMSFTSVSHKLARKSIFTRAQQPHIISDYNIQREMLMYKRARDLDGLVKRTYLAGVKNKIALLCKHLRLYHTTIPHASTMLVIVTAYQRLRSSSHTSPRTTSLNLLMHCLWVTSLYPSSFVRATVLGVPISSQLMTMPHRT